MKKNKSSKVPFSSRKTGRHTSLECLLNNNSLKEMANSRLATEKNNAKVAKGLEKIIFKINRNDYHGALTDAQRLNNKYPSTPKILNTLGFIAMKIGLIEQADMAFEQAIELNAKYEEAIFNLAHVKKIAGNANASLDLYQKVISINPKNIEAIINLGNVYIEIGQFKQAYTTLLMGCEISPNDTRLFVNIATALINLDKPEAALEAINWAYKLDKKDANLLNTFGGVLLMLGDRNGALKKYKEALIVDSENEATLNNIGLVIRNTGDPRDSIAWFAKAIELNPNFDKAYTNLGAAYMLMKEESKALVNFKKSLQINPESVKTITMIADACLELGHVNESIQYYTKAFELDSNNLYSLSKSLHCARKNCIWDLQLKNAGAKRWDTESIHKQVTPFTFLSIEDDPLKQLERSKAWTSAVAWRVETRSNLPVRKKNKKIRIGYFSADFHDFPGMYLMAGMLESHNRTDFEVFAFSYGPEKNDGMRKRIVKAVDHFIDIRELSIEDTVELCDDLGIDIAIHRNGHTANGRTGIFARRLATVQINYLGYPGSLGADFIDYMIADEIVIPETHKKYYSEEILYMPHCYQPNDDKRVVAETSTTKSDFGLPEDGFVFCCFNNSYKISSDEYDVWMRILGRIANSVLWILKSNEQMVQNLRKEASARGIDPDRIVFAEKLPQAEHMARHKHADLFLDTFNYNAHTTASDALWMGLPVVTKIGEQFAARVSASLLNAIGVPELVTNTVDDYENLIFDLATNNKKLNHLRKKILENRISKPLFDTKKYTRDFERLLQDSIKEKI